jgi:GABA permease
VRILTFYVGSVLLIVTVVPWIDVRPGESPFTLALTTMHFPWASVAMSAVILTAVLSCLNSAFYVCSRVLFVLAEHGDAPKWLVQLNTRRVPTRSVWVGSLAGVLGILAAINYPQTVFAFLVNASGALMVFIYMIVALAHIRLRRAREARGEPEPALTMWLFPWASYAAVGGMAAILIAMALSPGELATELRVSVLALAVAVLAYLILDTRRKARSTRLVPAPPPAERS